MGNCIINRVNDLSGIKNDISNIYSEISRLSNLDSYVVTTSTGNTRYIKGRYTVTSTDDLTRIQSFISSLDTNNQYTIFDVVLEGGGFKRFAGYVYPGKGYGGGILSSYNSISKLWTRANDVDDLKYPGGTFDFGVISDLNTVAYPSPSAIYSNYIGYADRSTANKPDLSGSATVIISSTDNTNYGRMLYISDRSIYTRKLEGGSWGSWVEVLTSNSLAVQTALPTANTDVLPTANNHLLLMKTGKVVQLTGYIEVSTEIPSYTKVFTLPDGYLPKDSASITPLNVTDMVWLFVDGRNGEFYTQNFTLSTGRKYFTSTWITA